MWYPAGAIFQKIKRWLKLTTKFMTNFIWRQKYLKKIPCASWWYPESSDWDQCLSGVFGRLRVGRGRRRSHGERGPVRVVASGADGAGAGPSAQSAAVGRWRAEPVRGRRAGRGRRRRAVAAADRGGGRRRGVGPVQHLLLHQTPAAAHPGDAGSTPGPAAQDTQQSAVHAGPRSGECNVQRYMEMVQLWNLYLSVPGLCRDELLKEQV